MFLGNGLVAGQYKILTIGGMSESFSISDGNGGSLSPGITMLEDVRIALVRGSATVSHEFPPLWVGKTTEVDYRGNLSVWPIYLVKNTNRFNMVLATSDGGESTQPEGASYTFGIITPEGAVYGDDNLPQNDETVTYTPYSMAAGEKPDELWAGRINTARLFYGENYTYRIVVRETTTGQTLWNYDLMKLLELTKPASRPDGTALPMQEYLDRQSEWNIVILYKGSVDPEEAISFIAVGVAVNNWILWLKDIDM